MLLSLDPDFGDKQWGISDLLTMSSLVEAESEEPLQPQEAAQLQHLTAQHTDFIQRSCGENVGAAVSLQRKELLQIALHRQFKQLIG